MTSSPTPMAADVKRSLMMKSSPDLMEPLRRLRLTRSVLAGAQDLTLPHRGPLVQDPMVHLSGELAHTTLVAPILMENKQQPSATQDALKFIVKISPLNSANYKKLIISTTSPQFYISSWLNEVVEMMIFAVYYTKRNKFYNALVFKVVMCT